MREMRKMHKMQGVGIYKCYKDRGKDPREEGEELVVRKMGPGVKKKTRII